MRRDHCLTDAHGAKTESDPLPKALLKVRGYHLVACKATFEAHKMQQSAPQARLNFETEEPAPDLVVLLQQGQRKPPCSDRLIFLPRTVLLYRIHKANPGACGQSTHATLSKQKNHS